jgi:hypothetical protein
MASLKHMEKIAQLDPLCSSLGMLLGSFSMVVEEVIVMMVGAGGAVVGVGSVFFFFFLESITVHLRVQNPM